MAGKVFYNKLIRDLVPEHIRAKGSECEVRQMGQEEFERELLRKAEEEASALPGLSSAEEIAKELADLLEVIDEVKKAKGITDEALAEARAEAMRKKGGFEKRLFLTWSSDDGYQTNEKKG